MSWNDKKCKKITKPLISKQTKKNIRENPPRDITPVTAKQNKNAKKLTYIVQTLAKVVFTGYPKYLVST